MTRVRAAWQAAIGAVALGVVLPGCTSLDYYDQDRDLRLQQERILMQQRAQAAAQDSDRATREIAALRTDLVAFQQSQRRLYEAIDELRQENHLRGQEIERLRGLVASLESRMATSDGQWRNDMSEFRQKLAQEQQRTMSKLTSNLAEEMERNLTQIRQATEAQQQAATAAAVQGEYTVQPGDTLSAIATAFRVSIDRLKEANGLKSDVIRVGQKLRIPAAR